MKAILIFILSLVSFTVFSQTASSIPTLGLKASFPFNGNSFNTNSSNNAIVNGATLTKDRFDQNNHAYHLNSRMQNITIPTYSYTSNSGDFSVSFWFKSFSETKMFVFNINDSNQYVSNFNFDINDGNSGLWTFWRSSGSNAIYSGVTHEYSNGYWHNFVFTQKDSTYKLYFDGNLQGTVVNNSIRIDINKEIVLSDTIYPFIGDVDDILIYDRALSNAEIRDLVDANITQTKLLFRKTTDAFQVGANTYFQWQKPITIDSLILEYALNNSNNWQLISNSVPANDHRYNWVIPNNPGSTFKLKITNKFNSQEFAISDSFLISKYQWQELNVANNFAPRDGAGAFVFKDTMFLMGGWTEDVTNYPDETNDEIWASDSGGNWTFKGHAPWEKRHTFGPLIYNNKMWVVGGDQLQDHFQKDVWNSSDGVNWTQITNNVPWGERMTHITCVFDNKMWVMGGQKIIGYGNEQDTVFNDVWNSTDGINWTQVTTAAPWAPRGQIEGSVVFNGKMWIMGGGTYNGTRIYYNDVWNTTDGINWVQVSANTPWEKREYHEIAVYNNAMWVIGGYDDMDNKRDVWYSEDGVNWLELVGTPWPPRHASSVFNYKQSLYVVAGNLWNDSWKLNTLSCPVLNNQPQNQNALVGNTASFTTTYNNSNDQFQWQIFSNNAWVNLTQSTKYLGINSCTLTVNNLNYGDNNSTFRCVLTSGACADTSNAVVLNVSTPAGLKQNENVLIASLFPNPSHDKLNIRLSESQTVKLNILDIQGHVVKSLSFQGNDHVLDISDLSNGIYFVELNSQYGKKVQKFIKS